MDIIAFLFITSTVAPVNRQSNQVPKSPVKRLFSKWQLLNLDTQKHTHKYTKKVKTTNLQGVVRALSYVSQIADNIY